FGNSLGERVSVGAGVDGAVSGGLDWLWNVEVRLADAQVDGIFQTAGQLEDLANAGGLGVVHTFGNPVVVRIGHDARSPAACDIFSKRMEIFLAMASRVRDNVTVVRSLRSRGEGPPCSWLSVLTAAAGKPWPTSTAIRPCSVPAAAVSLTLTCSI